MVPRQLKTHERIWLEEVRTRLASGKPIDYPEMMVALRDKLPRGFTPNLIDPWYLQGAEITVAGIHALDPNAQELKDLERLLFKVKEWFIENSHRQAVSAEEYAVEFGESFDYIARLLALAGTLDRFWSTASGIPGTPTNPRLQQGGVLILGRDGNHIGIRIDRELASRACAHRDNQVLRTHGGTPRSRPTTDSENDPTEEDNTPFSAEEQVQIKRGIEEVRVYIRSTYSPCQRAARHG